MQKEIVNGLFTLEKFSGKGGWTYAELPILDNVYKNSFGWFEVNGQIDTLALTNYKLMPMGKGRLFLPVKAEIRKKINKQEGDVVSIILFAKIKDTTLKEDIITCIKDESNALYNYFTSLSSATQDDYLLPIINTPDDTSKVEKINHLIFKLKNETNQH